MLRIKFLLRQPNKPGIKAIYATVRFNNQTTILYPGISIHTDAWVRKNGNNKPKDNPENYDIIDALNDYAKLIRETYKELQKKSVNDIALPALLKKAVYAKHLGKQVEKATTPIKEGRVLIVDFFQTLIDDTKSNKRLGENGKIITKGTINTYHATMKNFIKFQDKQAKKYYLTDINQKLIDSFSDFVHIDLNMMFNSAGKNMKTFKVMMNYARKKKLISNDIIVDSKITITREVSDSIYLDKNEIDKMAALKNFPLPIHEITRDYFLLGANTGLRFSDFSLLQDARINNDYINITTRKTNNKITIPIHPIVKKVLEKYSYKLPKCPPNQVFNRHLKEIGKMIPELHQPFEKTITRARKTGQQILHRFEGLSSHSCRRSFCTNEYLNGTPTITIMAISGHTTEKAFMTYIKANALQHAQLMRDNWNKKRNEDDEKAA